MPGLVLACSSFDLLVGSLLYLMVSVSVLGLGLGLVLVWLYPLALCWCRRVRHVAHWHQCWCWPIHCCIWWHWRWCWGSCWRVRRTRWCCAGSLCWHVRCACWCCAGIHLFDVVLNTIRVSAGACVGVFSFDPLAFGWRWCGHRTCWRCWRVFRLTCWCFVLVLASSLFNPSAFMCSLLYSKLGSWCIHHACWLRADVGVLVTRVGIHAGMLCLMPSALVLVAAHLYLVVLARSSFKSALGWCWYGAGGGVGGSLVGIGIGVIGLFIIVLGRAVHLFVCSLARCGICWPWWWECCCHSSFTFIFIEVGGGTGSCWRHLHWWHLCCCHHLQLSYHVEPVSNQMLCALILTSHVYNSVLQ